MSVTSGIEGITDSIFWIGENDRETDRFEGLWSLPHGVAYNSYLLRGEKNILIDTVKSSFSDDFLKKIYYLLEGRAPDYAIVNHMEPDHSGSLSALRNLFPGIKFIGNAKTAEMMKNFFGIEENVITVREGETVDLGGRRFAFALTPMVHWPESMVAYDVSDRILFSSDIFGGFGATEGGVFDDQADMGLVESEMMRYYVNIVGRFSASALKALAKVRSLDVGMICPAHGPIWRSDPERVISLYEKWSRQETEDGVVVAYGSMYGNTKAAAGAIAAALAERGVSRVAVYDMVRSDLSAAAADIWRNAGLILAGCTYNMELFPPMSTLIRHLESKNMKGRYVGLCGTFSWAEASMRELSEFVGRSGGGWTLVEPKILIKSAPKEQDFEQCGLLAANMADAVKRGRNG
ncbi:MAG: FprA family A-type flavoprotein [Synergistaceae bacterium]|jgi:flavorubredoxin|nr:FprA family A-type flavoprotein [Synergistaceae bacterium]